MRRFVEWLLGCSHRRTTFPLTPAGTTRTYIACLDCGREFYYDWRTMRAGAERGHCGKEGISASIEREAQAAEADRPGVSRVFRVRAAAAVLRLLCRVLHLAVRPAVGSAEPNSHDAGGASRLRRARSSDSDRSGAHWPEYLTPRTQPAVPRPRSGPAMQWPPPAVERFPPRWHEDFFRKTPRT